MTVVQRLLVGVERCVEHACVVCARDVRHATEDGRPWLKDRARPRASQERARALCTDPNASKGFYSPAKDIQTQGCSGFFEAT